ncbi:hypothetical protein [Pontibacter arcticus]|uniref:SpoIIAA-like n=1 Tax=Pontibacter arcticus TaxID=2080288 RepID=A0A364RFV1_9BACT|nr:hypothetical protein [Pontibacter arcticus]RAU83163.1 hypothetical protein DP923_08015 [Pontibacter arcticus]
MDSHDKILLYATSYITIELNLEDDWLYVEWRGIVGHQNVVAECEKILYYVKENKVTRIVNDNTLVEGIWSAAARWVGEVWFPALQEAGLKQFAWIYSPSILSRLSTDKTIKNTERPDLIKTFDDIDLAKDWLRVS